MTRPLYLRDRCPEPGDVITSACRIDPMMVTEVYPLVRAFRVLEIAGMLSWDTPWYYIARRDGGPVEVAREAVAL